MSQADHCPRCGQPNVCAMTLPAEQRPAQCWCVAQTFSPGVLEGMPTDRCLCQRCARSLDRRNE